MNPIRITTPTEPVTLAEAKLHLRGVDDTAEDALITALISAARETCEDRIEGTIPATGWRLTERGLYRTLRRLTSLGLLRVEEVAAPRTGAKRKDYSPTTLGIAYLARIEKVVDHAR